MNKLYVVSTLLICSSYLISMHNNPYAINPRAESTVIPKELYTLNTDDMTDEQVKAMEAWNPSIDELVNRLDYISKNNDAMTLIQTAEQDKTPIDIQSLHNRGVDSLIIKKAEEVNKQIETFTK